MVTRYEDERTVCGHPELFSSAQPGLRGVPVRLIRSGSTRRSTGTSAASRQTGVPLGSPEALRLTFDRR